MQARAQEEFGEEKPWMCDGNYFRHTRESDDRELEELRVRERNARGKEIKREIDSGREREKENDLEK